MGAVLDHLPTGLTLLVLVLYLLGERRAAVLTGRPRSHRGRMRSLRFYAGLLAILAAVEGPIDAYADKLLLAHMIQHLLLIVVAPPLIVLGAPWMSVWRPLPLGFRRAVARAVTHSPYGAPLRALTRPLVAWLLFNLDLVAWHVPAAYDLTLRNAALHALEHITFLLFSILLWSQVVDSPPLRARLSELRRIAYLAGVMVVNVAVAMVLAFSPSPLYDPYVRELDRPIAISALSDQQIAGGIMWTAGMVPFEIAIALLAQRWLARDDAVTARIAPAANKNR